jgi:hypothetical protein
MSETRKQRKERLQAEGRWHEFLALRDRFAAEGMKPAQAREEALRLIDNAPVSELGTAHHGYSGQFIFSRGSGPDEHGGQNGPEFTQKNPRDDAAQSTCPGNPVDLFLVVKAPRSFLAGARSIAGWGLSTSRPSPRELGP